MRPTGSIRQRTKGCFQIRYSQGVDPLTGKRKRIEVIHKGTYDTARQELRRLLRSVDDNQHVEPTKIKVGEFLTQWLESIHSQVSPKTHERYTEIVKHFLIPALGHCLLAKLMPVTIQTVYNRWETSGRRDGNAGGLSPRTRLHIHRIFSCALKHAVRLQLIVRNPVDAVKAPRVKKVPITTLTVGQAATLLDALREAHPRLYWPVLLALTTGMRRGEILALRWKNVDFERKTVRVVESLELTTKGFRFKAPKTERSRAVILLDYAVEELKIWKEKQAKELLEKGVTQNRDSLVCGWMNGNPMRPDKLTGEFVRIIRTIKEVPKIRFHDLRHSHATQLLAEGIHPKIAQERLGHSSITTTLDLYSHVTDTMQDEAAAKLDSAFQSAIKTRPLRSPKPG